MLEEGRSSGLAGGRVTLPVTPREAWEVDGREQWPLLPVRLSAPLHPRNAATSAGIPEHLSCIVASKSQASGRNPETGGTFSVYGFPLFSFLCP